MKMIDVGERETAVVIGLISGENREAQLDENLDELILLADTAGADVRHKISQERSRIDSATYIGSGKAKEIGALVEEEKIDMVVFDDDLSPVQVRNLEKLIKCKIIDRSGLILDIFASRAKTKEAMTQVELAQLQYMLPRLTRQWTHLSKQYGGVGTKGPGETQIETDRARSGKHVASFGQA
jgi:GTP-binding protein HflX